jgi:hypothetical protein
MEKRISGREIAALAGSLFAVASTGEPGTRGRRRYSAQPLATQAQHAFGCEFACGFCRWCIPFHHVQGTLPRNPYPESA